MRHGRYILRAKIPVPCEDLLTWGRWLEDCPAERIVRQEYVGQWWVSICFLGLDHSFSLNPDTPPLLFETMIFRDPSAEDRRKFIAEGFECPAHLSVDEAPCAGTPTWELALEAHAEAVKWARKQQLQ